MIGLTGNLKVGQIALFAFYFCSICHHNHGFSRTKLLALFGLPKLAYSQPFQYDLNFITHKILY